jgi:hypothetical protein
MILSEDIYFKHGGVKGMRWGVRRAYTAQNKAAKKQKRAVNSAINKQKRAVNSATNKQKEKVSVTNTGSTFTKKFMLGNTGFSIPLTSSVRANISMTASPAAQKLLDRIGSTLVSELRD